nr:hypothetical protein [Tanacetum cinerariifolium]
FIFLKNGNSKECNYVLSLYKIHVVLFFKEDLEEKMNRWVRKEFKTFNEEVRIVEVVRVTTDQQHVLDYMEQILMMRENDKPNSFSDADFKYLSKNDIEDPSTLDTYVVHAINLVYCSELQISQAWSNTLVRILIEVGNQIKKVCDATLERVLKEVKLKIFETEFLKKAPLLGGLDLDIMKTYEKAITKCLRHREQMRRWELFVKGRPFRPTMRRQE